MHANTGNYHHVLQKSTPNVCKTYVGGNNNKCRPIQNISRIGCNVVRGNLKFFTASEMRINICNSLLLQC